MLPIISDSAGSSPLCFPLGEQWGRGEDLGEKGCRRVRKFFRQGNQVWGCETQAEGEKSSRHDQRHPVLTPSALWALNALTYQNPASLQSWLRPHFLKDTFNSSPDPSLFALDQLANIGLHCVTCKLTGRNRLTGLLGTMLDTEYPEQK